MKEKTKTRLLSALILSGAVFISGSSFAKDVLMHTKMQNGKMSQAEAWRARKEHKKLVIEILDNLNKRNAEVSTATSEVLSGEEILNNFKVMGRLLAMLAAEHPAQTDEWGYPLE